MGQWWGTQGHIGATNGKQLRQGIAAKQLIHITLECCGVLWIVEFREFVMRWSWVRILSPAPTKTGSYAKAEGLFYGYVFTNS
jgi:hypothetical protein